MNYDNKLLLKYVVGKSINRLVCGLCTGASRLSMAYELNSLININECVIYKYYYDNPNLSV